MNRPRLLGAAVAALAALLALSGCTAAVRPASTPTVTAASAAAGFRCPPAATVAGLTAVPFTMLVADAMSCTYIAGSGAERVTVVVRRGAGAVAPGTVTLTGLRRAIAAQQGVRVRPAPRFSPDAFTAAQPDGSCAAWVYSTDGVPTSITATRPAGDACTLATTAAVLIGTAARAVTPLVSVIAPDALLAPAGPGARFTTALSSGAGVRVRTVPSAGTGYVPATGFTRAAARVDPLSAAVVLLSDTSDAGGDRIAMLHSVTLALSRASATAPGASLIVVGPVDRPGASPSDATHLRIDLHTAARIAGAAYVDPAGSVPSSADAAQEITAAEPRVATMLRNRLR